MFARVSSIRRQYEANGVQYDHYAYEGDHAPDEATEDEVYATLTRVRDWDANVRAGWMPVGSGRKRAIIPAE